MHCRFANEKVSLNTDIVAEVCNRWSLMQEREKQESEKYEPINKTKGRVNGPKAHERILRRR